MGSELLKHKYNLDDCIRKCQECASVCTQTSMHCLDLGGRHADAGHQRLLRDCADICATAARFMNRGSPRHPHICRECAEICRKCADDCDRVAGGNADSHMTRCAAACRECASICLAMVSE